MITKHRRAAYICYKVWEQNEQYYHPAPALLSRSVCFPHLVTLPCFVIITTNEDLWIGIEMSHLTLPSVPVVIG